MNLEIREANINDLDRISKIEEICFPNTEAATKNSLEERIKAFKESFFVVEINNEVIGLVIWDPRNMPEYMEIGHNCIKSKYKGNGYGRIQLQEAVNRIAQNDVKKIIVTTNVQLTSAQRMYESIGFKFCQRRKNESNTDFSGEYIDYAINL